jgi:hypothetical protein
MEQLGRRSTVRSIADLLEELSPDHWRDRQAFDEELRITTEKLLGSNAEERTVHLREWLSRHQPCLFGRLAAKKDLITFCILDDEDLRRSDAHIRDKIQAARLEWTKAGYDGRKSGFVLLAASRRLAEAEPNRALQEFAQRLCQLYLLDECPTDHILHDEIYLEKPGPDRSVWKWLAGVNVFAAAGDGRWWQDHRIPGGVGFSAISVGHMVKSSQLSDVSAELNKIFGDAEAPFAQQVVDSLPKALDFAMRTIANATAAVSGRATMLLPDPGNLSVACPVALSPILKDMNYCNYAGYYHTDVTIPTEYFRPDVERPDTIKQMDLDFTYLFNDDDVDNSAFVAMGIGRRVRGELERNKTARANARVVNIKGERRLINALR